MDPLSTTTSLALERTRQFLPSLLLDALRQGHEAGDGVLLGQAEGGKLAVLPPQRALWGRLIVSLADQFKAECVAFFITAWLSHWPDLRPRDAPDRQSVLWIFFVDRANPQHLVNAWTYSIDHSKPDGTPGRIFDIKPAQDLEGRAFRSPHVDPLIEHWRRTA